MHYNASLLEAFNSVEHIMRDVNSGWLIRYLHANTASAFFLIVYLHIGRGLYYGSYRSPRTLVWTIGTIIFILMMATAFLGYVLPYGQMSLWGATVITNLMSAIPWVGQDIVEFIWGGFSVNNATLNRFFSLHFVLPFVLAALALMHLISLHDTAGSGNPLGVSANYDRLAFAPFFIFKDLITIFIFVAALCCFLFFMPNVLGDSENYVMANPMQTPPAIVPEWYLLPFYAILRSIPNKLLGVIAMFSAILILLIMPFTDLSKARGLQFRPASRIAFYIFIGNFLILMILGARHVEDPFIVYGQISTVLYFLYFLVIIPVITLFENSFNDMITKINSNFEQIQQEEVEESISSGTPSYAGIPSSVFNLSGTSVQKRQFSSTSSLSNLSMAAKYHKFQARFKEIHPLKSDTYIKKISAECKLDSEKPQTFAEVRAKLNHLYTHCNHRQRVIEKLRFARTKLDRIACFHSDRSGDNKTDEEKLHYIMEGWALKDLERMDNVDIPGAMLNCDMVNNTTVEAVLLLVKIGGYLSG